MTMQESLEAIYEKSIETARDDVHAMLKVCRVTHALNGGGLRKTTIISHYMMQMYMSAQAAMLSREQSHICIAGCSPNKASHEGHQMIILPRALGAINMLHHAFNALLEEAPEEDLLFLRFSELLDKQLEHMGEELRGMKEKILDRVTASMLTIEKTGLKH